MENSIDNSSNSKITVNVEQFEDIKSDSNKTLQSNDSSSGSTFPNYAESSQSSLEFGKGERRSPSPSPRSSEMLKYATSNNGSRSGGKLLATPPTPTAAAAANDVETNTTMKLPQRFVVKYLGFRETSNLWGIKYTRRPVDEMVNDAKNSLATSPEKALPLLKMEVTEEGVIVGPMPQSQSNPLSISGRFAIESISYGVQDLVYTRVFAMIVVKTDNKGQSQVKLSQLVQGSGGGGGGGKSDTLPFRCHAFVCDSRQTARKLTYSLASAFEMFSKKIASGKISIPQPKKFAIDLRSAEEIEAEMQDSEA